MDSKQIFSWPMHELFNLEINGGQLTTSNSHSYYRKLEDTKGLTFDVSNQKVLANCGVTGEIEMLTFYRGNILTEEKPGVWVNKLLSQTAGLKLIVRVNEKEYDLSARDHRIQVDLLKDCLPRYRHSYPEFQVIVVPFAPIRGGERLSMLVQQVFIVNKSQERLAVELTAIPLYQQKYSDQQNVLISQKGEKQQIENDQTAEFSACFIDPEAFLEKELFITGNTSEWLMETVDYFEQKFGQLELQDTKLKHLYNRSVYQAFASFGMDHEGRIVGSNWGSYPATERIWNKDMYYASLPFVFTDRELCQETIRWFDRYGVKFPGTKFPGGLNHSLSNSLASALLSSLYFEYTGDLSFFEENAELLQRAAAILDAILAQHHPEEPYLFESMWLSDAFALGKYHTGSNLCVWKSCEGLARIFKAQGLSNLSRKYGEAASKVKQAILSNMTTDGPFGEQFLEGIGDQEKKWFDVRHYEAPIIEQGLIFLSDVINDGKIDLLMHDGEESDTTLIPFYHFLDRTDIRYQNTMRFAASRHNPTYSESLSGITWGLESGATFPGFITVLMSKTNDQQRFNEQLEELMHLADLDGSWWWWPYELGKKRGDVIREFGCGKCGWASGMFVSSMVTQYFGIDFHEGALSVEPIEGLEYSWSKVHFGRAYITIECKKETVKITNLDQQPIVVINEQRVCEELHPGKTITIVRKKR